ncbi:MAG: type II secretion system F family protein [Planctomycetes bacterium]|nr:type II secretion system F family protein [Planctomycetota bacterium]
MPKFRYVARDAMGNKVEDELTAKSHAAAMAQLKRNRLNVLTLSEAKKGFALSLTKPKPRVKAADLVIFTRQFSTMVEAGLPVVEILDILLEQTDDPGFKSVVSEVRSEVRGGSDLSSALAKWPKCFSPIYINLIKAGEASGDLDVILKRLAVYLEKNASLKRKIISAMTYPVASLGLIILITVGLLVFIVPQFVEIFDGIGAELPLPTRMVMAISDTLMERWYAVLAAIIGFFVFLWMVNKNPRGRYIIDSLKLKSPVFGELFQKVALSRFARTFSTMLRSGVPMLGSLEIVSATAGNGVVEEAVTASREAVRQGESLAAPLSESPVFPPMVVRMISVGERTGALETLLEKVADFYDEQVDAAVESLTSVIEPVMIGLMGVVVGFIVIALFLPILELQNQV